MAFINALHSIIKKSNRDILNFYSSNNNLFIREFNIKSGWKTPKKLLNDVDEYLFNIKIDNSNKVYGIASPEGGDVLYFYSDKDDLIKEKKLFSYNSEKYSLMYPYIMKIDSTLCIIYFFQDMLSSDSWTLFSHYFDGKVWYEFVIDSISAHPFVPPFVVTFSAKKPTVFYLKNEEIFSSTFNADDKTWALPIQLTNTSNKKMYLSVLQDNTNTFHLSWSEFIADSLTIRYFSGSFKKDSFSGSKITNLSEPSNTSYPSIIKTSNKLWIMWVQLDKLYSRYSIDNGNSWSDAFIDPKSCKHDFIRYKFFSNCDHDLKHLNVDWVFGTFNPRISFIGFDKSIES
ncbi:hypothetical protein R9X47_03660 [Wukongibacter baidiensis]|uniref:hypothetical protein n=1 Tax=Wukongibacter baidiensis TaxID=1723361 RepID=UPI003D7F5379